MIGGLLSGFVQGFQVGTKTMASYDDAAYKKKRGKYLDMQGAYLGQKIKELQDPEMRQLKIDSAKQVNASRAKNAQYQDFLMSGKMVPGQGGTPPEIGAPVQGPVTEPAPVPKPQSAIPTGTNVAQNDEPLDEPDDSVDADQTQFGAKGGLIKRQAIKHYEDGGFVDDDEEEPDDEDDTLPEGASSTAGAQPYGGFSTQASHDATLGGLQVIHAAAASHRTAVNPTGGGRAVVAGKGAAGPMLTQQVLDRVDPKHEMGEGARNMAGLSAVYQYYMGKGQPKEASTAAAALLQQYRTNMAHYAALSAAALKAGHLDAAAAYAFKSYANVPDGRNLKLTNENGKLGYELTDEKTGKVQKKGIMSPQEFGASLTGFTPDKFEEQIAAAAGVRAGKGAKLQQADKPKDRDQSQKNLDEAYGTPKEGDTKADDIKSAAYQILNAPGQKILEKDAVNAAKGILYVDPKNPDTPQWKAEKVDIDGTPHAKVTFDGNKRSVIVPTEVMGSLLDQRAAAVAEAQAAGKKKEGENKRAGENADAAKGIITSAGEVGRATGKIPGSPSWLAERAGPAISGAIDKVGGAIKGADKAATEYVDTKLKSYAASKRPQAIATGDEE